MTSDGQMNANRGFPSEWGVSMVQSFSFEAQERFARLSGDYNPIHMDPLVARRLMYGRPVVHGIHVLLWALDRWLEGETNRIRLTSLSVKFRSPTFLDEVAESSVILISPNSVKIVVTAHQAKLMTATISWQRQLGRDPDVPCERAPRTACRDRSVADLCTSSGRIPLCLEPSIASSLFPHVVECLPAEQVAVLLATSRLVGMEAPGLHSIFTGMELKTSEGVGSPALAYSVEGYDERVSLLNLRVDAPGLSGSLTALVRPAPRAQATMAVIRRYVDSGEFQHERALVIGGSRGLGEVAVKELAVGGAEVKLTYHRGALDAERVKSEVVSQGGVAQSFAYDVLTDAGELPSRVGEWSPTILCYFATPFISTAYKGRFSRERFAEFCEYYVRGFHDTFHAVRRQGNDLRYVLYPSSSMIDELPSSFAEYIAAKSAAEALCRLLEKTHPGIRIYAPRLPRLSTDQTASVLDSDRDAEEVVLAALREMRARNGTSPAD
jgi:acyl dehydratase/NAD(P)-dependent dehydrogenase (short-subunit alcohol dehydrogenase family)